MESPNPYQSPQFEPFGAEFKSEPRELEVASQGRRFSNYLLDQFLLFIIVNGISFALGVVIALAQGPRVLEDNPELELIFMLLGLLISVAYFVLFEATLGKTPAKFLTGTRVVTESGDTPSFGQVVGRSFARFIPFEPFSFLGGNKPVGWHDSLSKTRVVMDR